MPLLLHELGDVQEAIDAATEEVKVAVSEFEGVVAALLEKYAGHSSLNDLRKMIMGCQYACTANVRWR